MNVLVVARWTLLEARRRRLVLAGVMLSVAFVALFAVGFALLYQARSEPGRQVPGRSAGWRLARSCWPCPPS